jgi:hypothetical protein
MPTNLTDLPEPTSTQILVCLPELPDDSYSNTLEAITLAFPSEHVLIATRTPGAEPKNAPTLTIVPYKTERGELEWVLTAADYGAAANTALEHKADTVLLLSNTAASNDVPLLRDLVSCVREKNVDLAVPHFALGPNDGLVNAALFYPLTRALFGADIHLPLPVQAAFSTRMVQRLAMLKPHHPAQNFLWPVAEAATAGFSVREIETEAPPPIPPDGDFNALFNSVAGSLFADVDAKAPFWQRARAVPSMTPLKPAEGHATQVSAEIESMIENFHLAQANLQEIWSLVLPPQTRLEIKRLSQLPSNKFAVTYSLWARIVYDFVLAYHLRTLNRGHLLGAMTPLYLAWVASHLRTTHNDATLASQYHEQTAAAFEMEKPYLVSRWRWPDRFNP